MAGWLIIIIKLTHSAWLLVIGLFCLWIGEGGGRGAGWSCRGLGGTAVVARGARNLSMF